MPGVDDVVATSTTTMQVPKTDFRSGGGSRVEGICLDSGRPSRLRVWPLSACCASLPDAMYYTDVPAHMYLSQTPSREILFSLHCAAIDERNAPHVEHGAQHEVPSPGILAARPATHCTQQQARSCCCWGSSCLFPSLLVRRRRRRRPSATTTTTPICLCLPCLPNLTANQPPQPRSPPPFPPWFPLSSPALVAHRLA